ncbi:methyltransferase [Thiohalobacter sp. COW1]|uniref:class I SAM-dependent methyltransferase n=1 Tax=Thiohalobacter sp. COW1 TaxID=2795687 RepID=UPI0019154045|nr:methyltransferase [Thiohalobacter sp. COW1]BCO32137.1 methyltransferase [Thiohalobacter sp. COW1]
MPADDYLRRIRQDIVFTESLRDQQLSFHTTWGLFSPREIDEGTRLLLRHIEVNAGDDCFDLGCGYGPIGLTLARLAPAGQTLMVDKDFMAVEYANRNAEVNGISNARAMLSNAFQHVDPKLKFDLIASNVPAKVGKELLAIILHDAHARLRPGGRLWVVSITGLRRLFEREMKAVFGNYDKVKQGRQYTVAMAVRG